MPCRFHPGNGRRERRRVRQVEDEQVVWRRCPPGGVPHLPGELEVVCRLAMAEHDSVEPIVVAEFSEYFEPETVPIECDHGFQVIRRPSDTEMRERRIRLHTDVLRVSASVVQFQRT